MIFHTTRDDAVAAVTSARDGPRFRSIPRFVHVVRVRFYNDRNTDVRCETAHPYRIRYIRMYVNTART